MTLKRKIIINVKIVKAMIFIVAFNLLVPMSCSREDMSYAEYIEFDNENWRQNEIVEYKLEFNDSSKILMQPSDRELILSLRHTSKYHYKELWVEMKFFMADSAQYADTVELCLIKQNSRRAGKGFGGVYEVNQKISSKYNLSDIRTVELRHIMNDSILYGIKNIGILITNKR